LSVLQSRSGTGNPVVALEVMAPGAARCSIIAVTNGYALSQKHAHALLLQRTGYQPRWVPVVKKLGFAGWYDSKVAAHCRPRQLESLGVLYRGEAEQEADSVIPHLPEGTTRLMDLGCGLAAADLAIGLRLPDLSFSLVDQDRFEDRPHYGFEAEASAYNSLAETMVFLTQNGLAVERVETTDMLSQSFPSGTTMDAVISLISWGFHYPVETYVNEVFDVLRPNGVVILDVRRGTNGLDVLSRRFGADAVMEIRSPHDGIPRALAVKK
jgi:SAM-dependent methyltransferase